MTMKPTIGFDALFLEYPMTGMGQYALRLWQELIRSNEIGARLLMPADAPQAVRELAEDRGVSVPVPLAGRLPKKARKVWWEQRGVVLAARRGKVDLVHVPYFAAPLRQPMPFVVTIHDAIPFALPEYRGGRVMSGYLRLVGSAARRARLILTDSEFSAGDIHRYLDIPNEKIRPIPLAVGAENRPACGVEDEQRLDAVRQRFGLARPFVLNVGGFDRRKNLPALIEGFARALPGLQQEIDLVIVGAPHSDNAEFFPPLQPIIGRYGVGERVCLTGFVSEQDKLDLYRAATVFVFPSTYEGFGLNPLEAMACGTPVISSNRASLPEVVGEAGLTIDPTPESIAAALVTVLNDGNLRESLCQRGLERAQPFSWRETARQTVAAYNDVLSNLDGE